MYTHLLSHYSIFLQWITAPAFAAVSHDEKKRKEEEGCLCPNEVLKVSARMTADLFIGDVVKIVVLMIRRINGPVSDLCGRV